MHKAIISFLCLAAGAVFAQETSDATAKDDDPVDLRVDVFEVIDVTAEKAPVAAGEETDPDIDAILEEAEAIESE